MVVYYKDYEEEEEQQEEDGQHKTPQPEQIQGLRYPYEQPSHLKIVDFQRPACKVTKKKFRLIRDKNVESHLKADLHTKQQANFNQSNEENTDEAKQTSPTKEKNIQVKKNRTLNKLSSTNQKEDFSTSKVSSQMYKTGAMSKIYEDEIEHQDSLNNLSEVYSYTHRHTVSNEYENLRYKEPSQPQRVDIIPNRSSTIKIQDQQQLARNKGEKKSSNRDKNIMQSSIKSNRHELAIKAQDQESRKRAVTDFSLKKQYKFKGEFPRRQSSINLQNFDPNSIMKEPKLQRKLTPQKVIVEQVEQPKVEKKLVTIKKPSLYKWVGQHGNFN